MRVPAAGSQLNVKIRDAIGFPDPSRTCRPGQANLTVQGLRASRSRTGSKFATAKIATMIRYGAYARATSRPPSRSATPEDATPEDATPEDATPEDATPEPAPAT